MPVLGDTHRAYEELCSQTVEEGVHIRLKRELSTVPHRIAAYEISGSFVIPSRQRLQQTLARTMPCERTGLTHNNYRLHLAPFRCPATLFSLTLALLFKKKSNPGHI